jgi:hypothetical protein
MTENTIHPSGSDPRPAGAEPTSRPETRRSRAPGARCRHVPRDRAHAVVAGYTIASDVSVRDWPVRTPTMTLGDPHALRIPARVEDGLRRDGTVVDEPDGADAAPARSLEGVA